MSRFALVIRTPVKDWTAPLLATLRHEELDGLAQLLGIASSGTKATKITRLVTLGQLRETVKTYTSQADLAAAYRLVVLREFAKSAGTYRWTTKHGIAGGLLQWRDDCRRRGQEAYAAARAAATTQPQQRRLPLEDDHDANPRTPV